MPKSLSKAEAAAARLKAKQIYGSKKMVSASVSSTNRVTERALRDFENEMKLRIVRYSTRAAAAVVRFASIANLEQGSAPRGPGEGMFPGNSMETGTFEKKSQEQQFRRETQPSMVDKVWIKPKVYNNGEVYLCMVGPRRPWGSQAWILEWGGVIQLWGTSRYYYLRPRPFLEPAAASTIGQQKRAYVNKHKQMWRAR